MTCRVHLHTSLWPVSGWPQEGPCQCLGKATAWCDKVGVVSLQEVQERSEDLATGLKLSPADRGSLGLEKILGLASWLDLRVVTNCKSN